jgi:mRNA-degrading endonuclease RelE of RelBE toxin-antitoxin system
MEARYSQKAVKQLKNILKGDRNSAIMIVEHIEKYLKNPHEKFDIKILRGKYGDFSRLRAGNY